MHDVHYMYFAGIILIPLHQLQGKYQNVSWLSITLHVDHPTIVTKTTTKGKSKIS